jgi:hypothetical protein
MPIHIEELTSNVTITQEAASHAPNSPPVMAATVPAAEELPPLEMVVSNATAATSAHDTGVGLDVQETTGTAAPAESAPPVDPQALAERVYRLMREDLMIARERE